MTELKPCPFCGGDATYGRCMTYTAEGWCVKCTKCGARSVPVYENLPEMTINGLDETTRYNEDEAKRKTAEAWNKRVVAKKQSKISYFRKCGGCEWGVKDTESHFGSGNAYVRCMNPDARCNMPTTVKRHPLAAIKARSTTACKLYVPKEDGNDAEIR